MAPFSIPLVGPVLFVGTLIRDFCAYIPLCGVKVKKSTGDSIERVLVLLTALALLLSFGSGFIVGGAKILSMLKEAPKIEDMRFSALRFYI